MKDFEKTIGFVRDFNSFSELLSQLWNGHGKDDDRIIGKMREYCSATSMRGEELASEFKEVCPDVAQMQQYYDIWCSVLERLGTTPFLDEDFSDAAQWASKLDDDDKGLTVAGFIRKMEANYNDVMDGRRCLENTYGLNSEGKEKYYDELKENFKTSNKKYFPGETADDDNIPYDILRLFGHDKAKYQEYINACKGQRPKEIARLYKIHGKIQLDNEKGIVTLLYNHLTDLQLLNCAQRTFQEHYSMV